MALYLILTSEIADEVRESLASVQPIYQPIQRAGGKFILPVSVLTSEPHSDQWEILGTCPQLEPSDPEFPGEYEPPES